MTNRPIRTQWIHRLAILLGMLACVSAVHAQGVTNPRDGNGNLVRNNGIATQNAPRPMTNNSTQLTQTPNNARPPVVVKRQP
jgi:hypothetical protein